MATDYPTLIHERNALACAGENSTVICRMQSGWAVLGDHQFFRGYCLLNADPEVEHLTDLDEAARTRFLLDMALVGEASVDDPAFWGAATQARSKKQVSSNGRFRRLPCCGGIGGSARSGSVPGGGGQVRPGC